MKRLFLLFTLVVFALCANAQSVTKFLGIPVDGTEYAFKNKLKAKGFKTSRYATDALEGEFNGEEVFVSVQTKSGKVWRVAVMDKVARSEVQIKIRFNNLLEQFFRNKKYFSHPENIYITDSERIGYEILINKKQYQGAFYQKEGEVSSLEDSLSRSVWFTIGQDDYGEYRIVIFYENRLNEADGSDL